MQIKALAARTGVSVDSLRHYEREGLLPTPTRQHNNYRDYGDTAVQQVVFIRNCRALDMSLDEVRALLAALAPAADPGCAPIDALIDTHLQHVRERLRSLRALERQLKALRASCAAPREGCGIVAALRAASPAPARRGVHSA